MNYSGIKIFVITFLLVLMGFQLCAQVGGYIPKRPDVFPRSSQYATSGWYFTPGITHTFGFANSERMNLGGDTIRVQHEKPLGHTGAFVQLGRFHTLKSRWINFVDYGLDVRWLRGLHTRETELRTDAENPEWLTQNGAGHFNDLWIGATVNASFARHITNTVFVSHSLGVNANYAAVRDLAFSGPYDPLADGDPPVFNAQLHYKLGVGFKLGRGWYLMPTIETPIFGIFAWNDAIPSLKYLNTYYQPILIGIQIMRLDRGKPEDCPTEGPGGKRKKNTSLWDKKMY